MSDTELTNKFSNIIKLVFSDLEIYENLNKTKIEKVYNEYLQNNPPDDEML